MKHDNRSTWKPNPHFKWPKVAPTESEENRLFPFGLIMWRARRSPDAHKFPYPLINAKRSFIHSLKQWRRIGEAKGKGSKALRRAHALLKKDGPYLNWPEMTITSI